MEHPVARRVYFWTYVFFLYIYLHYFYLSLLSIDLGDSDDETDFTKMDMGNKKGPVGRYGILLIKPVFLCLI